MLRKKPYCSWHSTAKNNHQKKISDITAEPKALDIQLLHKPGNTRIAT